MESNQHGKGSIMKMSKVIATMLLAVVLTASAAMAADAIKLKTSKEISGSIFGTQTHFGQWWDYKKVMPLIEKAGFKWIRDDGAFWHRLEREKGVFKFPQYANDWVNDAQARGIDVVMLIGNAPPKHYSFKDFEKFKEAYARYCTFMAETFKGRVKVWEMWNEPTNFDIRRAFGGSWNAKEGKDTVWLQRLVDITEVAAKAIRSVDPDVIIIGGANASPTATYHMLDMLKDRKLLHLLDGITIHPYSYYMPPEILPYGGKAMEERDGISIADDDHTYLSFVRRLKEKMKSVGMKNTDIYVTEDGYHTYYRDGKHGNGGGDYVFKAFKESTQAKYLARRFVLHRIAGIKVAIQYDFQDDGHDIKICEQTAGLVKDASHNFAPKPSFFAMQRICSLLDNTAEVFTPAWSVTLSQDRFAPSKWIFVEPYLIWDGEKIDSLNRAEKYLFKNKETGEVMLVLWHAIRVTDRQDLISDVTLDTVDYTGFSGIDIMTGKSFKVNASVKDGKTVFKDVIIPDYPVIIKMMPKK
ncbi:MAG: hypothetical protein DRP83_09135 [Planctomycetota bacterium]|nr:MAG: hypothetical protein DRP83_09135 [Planctomycetota bacterium]